jgi:hypothetical protein
MPPAAPETPALEIGAPNGGGSIVTAAGHHFRQTPVGGLLIAFAVPDPSQ